MSRRLLLAFAVLALGLAATLAGRIDVRNDLSFFLPRGEDAGAALLRDAIEHGPAAGLVLIALSGHEPQGLARASDALVRALENHPDFKFVVNGRARAALGDIALLHRHRYVLDPPLTVEAFAPETLRAGLERSLAELGTTAGLALAAQLPADPTRRMEQVLHVWTSGVEGPGRRHGVWFSRDGTRALLAARTQAPSFDVAQQQRILAMLPAKLADIDPSGRIAMTLTGPTVFAVATSAAIQRESVVVSLLASLLVVGVLWIAFRSLPLLGALAIPVAVGMLGGALAVQLAFGHVHGVTLTFGSMLIGVAIDYPIHLVAHARPGERVKATLVRIWPTLRLGVLTTATAFVAMTMSTFQGLVQLGLFSIIGLVAAGAATRWFVPLIVPSIPRPVELAVWERWTHAAAMLKRLRFLFLIAALLAAAFLASRGSNLWENDLARLSPIDAAQKETDRTLRSEAHAPDVRQLILIEGRSAEEVLQAAEALDPVLGRLVAEGALERYDHPARYLPSRRTQRERQSRLPDAAELEQALRVATAGLPFQPGAFAPFLRDLAQAREQAPIEPADLLGKPLAWRLDALLFASNGLWRGVVAPSGHVDATRVAQAVAAHGDGRIRYVDPKAESERLVAEYRAEALMWLALGAVGVLVVLAAGLRNGRAVAVAVLPIALAMVLTAGLVVLSGSALSLFHLVALLLVGGVGLDYALFFNRGETADSERTRTLRALVLCNVTTVIVFAVLAFSSLPVLHSIGLTVAIGSALSLLLTFAFARNLAAAAR